MGPPPPPPINPMLRYFYTQKPIQRGGEGSSSKGKERVDEGSSSSEPCIRENEGPPAVANSAANVLQSVMDEVQKKKRAYEMRRHFQDNWVARFPWAEAVQNSIGDITQVRCIVCTKVEGREKFLVPKIDGLWKHAGRRRAARDMVVNRKAVKAGHFYFTSSSHVKNEKVFAGQPQNAIVRQLERGHCEEKRKKVIQFKLLFHLLTLGRPMTDFKATKPLLLQLGVPNVPKKHWSDNSGWEMADSLAHVLSMRCREMLCYAKFVSLSADEVTTIDNQSWLSIHAYVVQNWKRFPILLSLSKIIGPCTAENIHKTIVDNTMWHANLNQLELAQKTLCLGADGAGVFQGCRAGVCRLFQQIEAPYLMAMHCCAHRTSLALDKLSGLRVIMKLENLCQVLYTYFNKSPKRLFEFQQLADTLELEGLKILRNVTTRWLFVKEPVERIYDQYQVLVAKMDADSPTIAAARRNLDFLLDMPTLLSFPAIMPLLSCVYTLVQFAQSREAYICDFMDAVKICQADLFMLYVDPTTAFHEPYFQKWVDYVGETTHHVSHDWRMDLETGVENLCLRIGEHSYPMHFLRDGITRSPVERADFELCKKSIMDECKSAARVLIKELDVKFPDSDLLNALGVVFPQFWTNPNADKLFLVHLEHIRVGFCEPKVAKFGEEGRFTDKVIDPPLSLKSLCESQSLFKLTMKTNAPKVLADSSNPENPMTRLWTTLGHSSLLRQRIGEWFKLAEISIVIVLGSVEDERTFSTLSFMKSKLRNKLSGHLDTTVKLFSQGFFTIDDFPYERAYDHWSDKKDRLGDAF